MPDHYPNTTNKGISASKFMDGSSALGKESNVGKLANITRRVTIRVGKVEKRSAINAEKITKLKNITKLRKENVDKKIGGSSSGLLDALNGINDNVNGMLAILGERQRFEKKVASDERKAAEKQGRGASEKKLESKAFDGLKGIAKKVLAPAMSLWDRLWEFLTTILLGRVAIKLWDWISDKKNQDKIKAIGRLFKDWWPAMLTGFVLFGTGMGRFITWMGAKLVAWGWTLLKTVIPVLWKAITAMGPWGWAALGAGAAIYGTGKLLGKDKVVENETERADTSREALEEAESTEDLSPGDREAIVQGTRLKDAGGGGSLNTMPDQFNDPLGLRNDPTGMGGMRLNQGGQVPGSGNSDSVSAKLTPGEFVVSAPAVQQWGADTFAAMNAMGGGGNTGSILRGFSEGGIVGSKVHPLLQKMSDENINKVGSRVGRCVEGTLNTMEASGVPEPAATGRDVGNNPRGAIVQMINDFGWKSMGGSPITLDSPYGTANAGVYSRSQYEQLVNSGKVPSGALVFQTRHDSWNGTSHNSRGYDMAIAQRKGMGLWNGQPYNTPWIYGGNTKHVIVLTPDGNTGDGKQLAVGSKQDSDPSAKPGGTWWNPLSWGKSTSTASSSTGGSKTKESGGGGFQMFGDKWTPKMGGIQGYDMASLIQKSKEKSKVPPPPTKPKTTVAYDNEMAAQEGGDMLGSQMQLPAINPSAMISVDKIKTLGITV